MGAGMCGRPRFCKHKVCASDNLRDAVICLACLRGMRPLALVNSGFGIKPESGLIPIEPQGSSYMSQKHFGDPQILSCLIPF